MKKLILILFTTISTVTFAQLPGGAGSGTGGSTGGGGSTTCSSPSFSASNTNSTISMTNSNVCSPASLSGIGASSQWTINNPSGTNILFRIGYSFYRTSFGVNNNCGVGYSSSFIVQNIGTYYTGPVACGGITGGDFTVSGNYYCQPFLQWYCSVDGKWYSSVTGNNSFSTTGTVNPANTSNNFMVNGLQNTGSIPIINQCPSSVSNLIMNNISTGLITNYQIKIEKSYDNNSYSTPISSTIVTASSVPSSINLNTLFGANLPISYTGFLRVSLIVTATGQCDNGSFTKTQVFKIQNISTQADFYMYKSGSLCPNAFSNLPPPPATASTICKPLIQNPTLIPTTMPTNKTLLCPALGWQGANSAGVTAIDVTGTNSWSLLVYEADANTGLRKVISGVNAPNINSYTGTGDLTAGQYLRFNDVSIDFNSSNPPFYNSTSTPVLNEYFSSYYTWASNAGQLTTFSSKVYCVELSVLTGTCNVTNKAYFRIANGVGGGQWKTTNNFGDEIDELNNLAIIYPNPSNGIFNLQYDKLLNDSKLIITDLLGNIIKTENNLKANNRIIDLSNFTNGIYFYKVFNGTEIIQGKLIKN